jgi:hypothetical protein
MVPAHTRTAVARTLAATLSSLGGAAQGSHPITDGEVAKLGVGGTPRQQHQWIHLHLERVVRTLRHPPRDGGPACVPAHRESERVSVLWDDTTCRKAAPLTQSERVSRVGRGREGERRDVGRGVCAAVKRTSRERGEGAAARASTHHCCNRAKVSARSRT